MNDGLHFEDANFSLNEVCPYITWIYFHKILSLSNLKCNQEIRPSCEIRLQKYHFVDEFFFKIPLKITWSHTKTEYKYVILIIT